MHETSVSGEVAQIATPGTACITSLLDAEKAAHDR